MRFWFFPALVILSALIADRAPAQDLIAKTEPRTPEDEHKSFKLPPGFEIQLVAAEPDIHKPMNIAFDARGRLWVTSTVEYPYPAPADKTPRDKVIVLSEFGEDGRARKVETFAEGLNIPMGILPIEGGALVFAIDHISKMLDTDGDGRADKVEKLLGTFGSRDTHGMTNHFKVGFDGWVYADHGFSNESEVKASDGSSITMQSGNVYRFKLDGSHVEYFTHGQVNPFGLCFDPRGDLFSADCHTRPQYLLLRGAYYPSFGKPDDGLGYGPEMCFHDHGSTAIAGTVYYVADHFPEAYHGTLFDGNPVTGRINHDTLEWHGSSPRAIEQPDFLSSDDPWFRPVDLVLGPDGAMYVADFYNRIIGHYEVPLDDPRRDRERGRIWRIVYRGEDGKNAIPAMPDLSAAGAEELVAALGDPNLSVRMMAQRQLVERVDRPAAIEALRGFDRTPDPRRKAHAMWALHLLHALPENLLSPALGSNADPLVRLHALRMIGDTPDASAPVLVQARVLLSDADAHVRRAAAEALGRHAEGANVRPLIAAWRAAPADDTHLIHTIRMALRDQLENDAVLAGLPALALSEDEQRAVADVMTGVANPGVGRLVLSYLKAGLTDPARTVQLLVHAARRLPPDEVDSLSQVVLQRFPTDLDVQRQMFVALLEGLGRRGAQPGDATRNWGLELARQLIAVDPFDSGAWSFHPLPRAAVATNPWAAQSRPSGAGSVSLWSSHPLGERFTGVLRSGDFEIPKTLRFQIAGHSGPPGASEPAKSFVRLKLAAGDRTVAESVPPRDDAAHFVEWNLSEWAGQKGYIEAVDGDDRDAYAWIAFGQFDPAVASTPADEAITCDRLIAASLITRALKLAELRGQMEQVLADSFADPMARAGAARALGAVGTGDSVKILAGAIADSSLPRKVHEAVAQSLAEQNSPESREALLAAIAVASEPLQRALATALVVNQEGGEALLGAVEAGKASPRLLQDAEIGERLKAAEVPELESRIKKLTKGLVPADEAIRRLLEQRQAAFDPGKASAARGAEVFTKNCAACHKIGDIGAVVGPQLDGVGQRGAERIIEDVLDPNRNVDAAFRTTILRLKTGDTVSGLLRREEGETIVLADSLGKENSIDKTTVARRAESALSLMPGNFGEIITPEEFDDLLAFLLSR